MYIEEYQVLFFLFEYFLLHTNISGINKKPVNNLLFLKCEGTNTPEEYIHESACKTWLQDLV